MQICEPVSLQNEPVSAQYLVLSRKLKNAQQRLMLKKRPSRAAKLQNVLQRPGWGPLRRGNTGGSVTHRVFGAEKGLAEDAVQIGPVSNPNSIITGKNTGKTSKLSLDLRRDRHKTQHPREFSEIFPARINREQFRRNRETVPK